MPDNKSWRKKIHNKHPKDFAPPKIGTNDAHTSTSDESGRRQLSWRKPVQSKCPETPSSVAPTTPTVEDVEDTRSERSETSTPRRHSKPKLARYTSLFSSFKESSRSSELTEPWGEATPPLFKSYIDPLQAVQYVRSHMSTNNTPIPLDYNNGLYCIFEDYGKVRDEKVYLESLLEDTLGGWRNAEDSWSDTELCYKAEIRRLDLLIAKGASGTAGLFQIRQSSVVDRTRSRLNATCKTKIPNRYSFLSQAQLDEEIKTKSRRILLHRSASPSERMSALSRQFIDIQPEILIDTPPNEYQKATLSRKVRSEVNLTILDGKHSPRDSYISSSKAGGSSRDNTATTPANLESAIEIDAFIALRELGELIAKRRGLRVDSFINSLTTFFTNSSGRQIEYIQGNNLDITSRPRGHLRQVMQHDYEQALTPKRILRRFQSQPQLNSDQRRCRHFSFEPGEDELKEVEYKIDPQSRCDWEGNPTELDDIRSSPRSDGDEHQPCIIQSTPPSLSLIVDFSKPSKIPSPLQTLGRVRRETSNSSSQSVFVKPVDGRRDSNSSVLTAYRENSSNNVQQISKSRSSSVHDLRVMDISMLRTARSGSLRVHNSAAVVAAVRGSKDEVSKQKGTSLRQNCARPSL